MAYIEPEPDFEKLASDELEAAAGADTIEKRRAHLDQAAIYAALGERSREPGHSIK
jgi:hypothetical protein